ncbi:hypothetical protein EW145_g3164 [Phellinidium pouzarii]|uniref:Peroxin/Ferlin domain-containing protein n=1 Tax=Phellinidium pouzarii TaxID=167371 RepID=A0A4V3XD00_9AGAM|nr:hypothetical protein EW145_g3164 [Phellinidium pouzarii]
MSSSSSPSRSSFDVAQTQTLPTLTTFLNNVPPQLTALLVELGPSIARIRWLAEAASWKASYTNSWIILAVWWAVCLLSEFSFRYFSLLIAPALYVYLSRLSSSSGARSFVTEQSLQSTVIDLSAIESLLVSLPSPPTLSWKALARTIASLYIPFLIVTWFWACTVREVFWRSAWFRRSVLRLWTLLSGQSPEPAVPSESSATQTGESGHSLRFLIMVYENQRWWVGLDWTAALLPGERPSWCSSTLDPMSPPSAFTLPEPTCVFLSDRKGGLIKRTARWNWEEREWKVVVRKEVGSKRIEKELPVLREDTSMHANRIGRAKQRLHETGMKLKKPLEGNRGDIEEVYSKDFGPSEPGSSENADVHTDEDEAYTDNDGWVYGDNKWKATSSNGGLGKYTRYRKWTRVALLAEVVEVASAEEAHNYAARQQETSSAIEMAEGSGDRRSLESNLSRRSVDENDDPGDEGRLRKRLKAVIRKSAHSV